ncbi:MAG TPA: radical SAM protein [Planctomycetota bacterium]|nr:radical SAM protein [Planctomycetota bacterium]
MPFASRAAQFLKPGLAEHPRLRSALRRADETMGRLRHSAAQHVPALIRAQPRQLTIAITAQCNLRCVGCRYGRDFMPGARLPLDSVLLAMEDARAGGVHSVRLYGGEPLLHPDLPAMIAHGSALGLDVYVTTNGTLLERRIDELFEAGLRWLTLGFYGFDEQFDAYTQRPALRVPFERGLVAVRERCGDEIEMQLNYVVVRPLADMATLEGAWALAQRHDMHFHLDLFGYSVPFFTKGPDDALAFRPEDAPLLARMVERLVEMMHEKPERFPHSEPFLRSVPDWVLECEDMRVPCDAYELLWIGADGTVQLCDTAFPLGNIHERRLKDILFGPEHQRAARDGFQLKCPNCNCKVDSRIRKHAASWRKYSRTGDA